MTCLRYDELPRLLPEYEERIRRLQEINAKQRQMCVALQSSKHIPSLEELEAIWADARKWAKAEKLKLEEWYDAAITPRWEEAKRRKTERENATRSNAYVYKHAHMYLVKSNVNHKDAKHKNTGLDNDRTGESYDLLVCMDIGDIPLRASCTLREIHLKFEVQNLIDNIRYQSRQLGYLRNFDESEPALFHFMGEWAGRMPCAWIPHLQEQLEQIGAIKYDTSHNHRNDPRGDPGHSIHTRAKEDTA